MSQQDKQRYLDQIDERTSVQKSGDVDLSRFLK